MLEYCGVEGIERAIEAGVAKPELSAMAGSITLDAVPRAGWPGTRPRGQRAGVKQSGLPSKQCFSFWANCTGHA